MLPVLLGVPGKLKTLLDRLTATRAGYLDNLPDLDTTVSSRAPATDTATLVSRLTADRAAALDALPNLGPPSAAWTTLPAPFASAINSSITGIGAITTGSLNNIPTGSTYTTMFSITGDCIMSVLAMEDRGVNPKIWTVQVEINSVTYDFTTTSMNSTTDTLFIFGGMTGDIASAAGVIVPQPVYCPGNFVLRVKHNDASAVTLYTHHKHLPV